MALFFELAVDVLDGALPEEEVDVLAVREGAHKVVRVQLTGVVLLCAQRLPAIGVPRVIIEMSLDRISYHLIMYVPHLNMVGSTPERSATVPA